jgi:hypothetical protein
VAAQGRDGGRPWQGPSRTEAGWARELRRVPARLEEVREPHENLAEAGGLSTMTWIALPPVPGTAAAGG